MDLDTDSVEISKPDERNLLSRSLLVRFKKLSEFWKAIESCKPTIIYRWGMNRGFFHNNILHVFTIPNRFPNVAEYTKAEESGFVDIGYDEWLEVTELGYLTAREYETAKGSYALAQWKNIRDLGYRSAEEYDKARGKYRFAQWKDILEMGYHSAERFDEARGAYSLSQWKEIHNLGYKHHREYDKERGPFGLQQWKKIRALGFKNIDEVQEAVNMGFGIWKTGGAVPQVQFDSKGIYQNYQAARRGGFEDKAEYEKAKQEGFESLKEWEEFRTSHFESMDEFLRAKRLGIPDSTVLRVYAILEKFATGSPVGISKIMRETGLTEPRLNRIFQLPAIQTLGFYQQYLGVFMRTAAEGQKEEKPSEPGFYKAVVVDGDNVTRFFKRETPELDCLVKVVEKLEKMGLEVYPYASEALQYYIDDFENFEKMLDKGDLLGIPLGTYSEFFLIQQAFDRQALVLSNSNFRELRETNPEEFSKIDNRRIRYTFIKGQPELDPKIKRLTRQAGPAKPEKPVKKAKSKKK